MFVHQHGFKLDYRKRVEEQGEELPGSLSLFD